MLENHDVRAVLSILATDYQALVIVRTCGLPLSVENYASEMDCLNMLQVIQSDQAHLG